MGGICTKSKPESEHLCQKCKLRPASYKRVFKLEKLPSKYILPYDSVCAAHIMYNRGHSYHDKIHFVDLPEDKKLTKYDYHVCFTCYRREVVQTDEWNEWLSE